MRASPRRPVRHCSGHPRRSLRRAPVRRCSDRRPPIQRRRSVRSCLACRTPNLRRPLFWIAYAVFAAAALAVAVHLFPRAIPLVNLDVRMNRAEALAAGEALAARLRLAPEGARSAARFDHDGAAQN